MLSWRQEVLQSLKDFNLPFTLLQEGYGSVVFFEQKGIALNLIDIAHRPGLSPEDLLDLKMAYAGRGVQLLQLWEDVWRRRKAQVLGRVRALLGLNQRLHGRKFQVEAVSRAVADAFMEKHHLLGAAGSKYRLALMDAGSPVALACFGPLRQMRRGGPGYRSAELVRFASLMGYTVSGGFTRLLRHFIREYRPGDVMTYADQDWSSGAAYEKSGFVLTAVTPPALGWLDVNAMQRYLKALPAGAAGAGNGRFVPVFNTGNLKYILYLDQNGVQEEKPLTGHTGTDGVR